MKSMRLVLTLAFVAMIAPNALAEGGNSGGGGVFVELDVLAIRTFLSENCDRFESFKKHQIDCTEFRKKIEEVGLPGAGLSIEAGDLFLDDGKAVDAINVKPSKLKLGQASWKSTGPDVALKAGLQAHEFLSLMGVEHTGYYPVSKDLVIELRFTNRFAGIAGTFGNSLAWIRMQFSKSNSKMPILTFRGHDQSGRACALYLTDKSYLESAEDYYIVVGWENTKDFDDYVGVVASQTVGSMSESELKLSSNEPWGNDTKFNKIEVSVNLFGNPMSAVGHSDKRNIECLLKGYPEVKPE